MFVFVVFKFVVTFPVLIVVFAVLPVEIVFPVDIVFPATVFPAGVVFAVLLLFSTIEGLDIFFLSVMMLVYIVSFFIDNSTHTFSGIIIKVSYFIFINFFIW